MRGAVAAVGLAAAALLAQETLAAPAEVAPGGVVRWPGDGTVTECSAAGRTWFPIAGDCYFPVDLETPRGELELARERSGVRETATVEVASYPYPEQRITVPERMVDLSPEDRARADRERERIEQLWGLRGPAAFTLPLRAPLERLPEGGNFGARRVFNEQPRSPHSGADFRAPAGTPVLAAADAEVALAGDFFFSGRSVFLDHGAGLVTMYFHLDEIRVAEGDTVAGGEVVGTVGSTGRSTGPHLHFGVRWLGARIDPALLMAPPSSLPAP